MALKYKLFNGYNITLVHKTVDIDSEYFVTEFMKFNDRILHGHCVGFSAKYATYLVQV